MFQDDFAQKRVLICGGSGTGKTTYLTRYVHGLPLDGIPYDPVFVFDHQGQLGRRLGVPKFFSLTEIEYEFLERGALFLCYDPADEFPGDTLTAFDRFCVFVFEASKGTDGKKLLVADEIQDLAGTFDCPKSFKTILESGRRCGLDTAVVSSQPNLLHNTVRFQTTEVVCFVLPDEQAQKWVRASWSIQPEEVAALSRGHFVAKDRDTGTRFEGCVF